MNKAYRLIQILTGLLLLLLLTSKASAAPPAGVEAPLEPLTTENISAFVEAYVAREMDAAHAPGLVISVVHRGELLHAAGYGLADLESGRPMTAQTPIRAGSVSKPLTSSAVLQLAARGEIELQTPISHYLPGLPLDDDLGPAGTVAQILTLQGGYPDAVIGSHAPTLDNWQPLEAYLQENLPERVLPAGVVHSYNSWEHALLGQMLAETAEEPFTVVMSETIFEPLGMGRSTFEQALPDPLAESLAQGYAFDGSHFEPVPLDAVNLSPGVGLITTAEDMGHWMRALLNEGRLDGAQVLDPLTVEGLLRRQEEVHSLSRGRTYGLSEATLAGRPVVYHGGNGIGFGNWLVLVPEEGLGIFLSVNHRALAGDTSHTLAYRFIKDLGNALLQRYVPAPESVEQPLRPPLPDAAARTAQFAGHYRLASTPQNDFFKLGALLDNVTVRDNGDGSVAIGTRRYVEVETNLFQSQSDPGFYVVFVASRGKEIDLLTFGGTGSYLKVGWYETPAVHLALVAAVSLISLAAIVSLPFSRPRHWLLWLLGVVNLLFILGITRLFMRADLIGFFKGIPGSTRLLLYLPWLGGLLLVTWPFGLRQAWQQPASWRRWLAILLGPATAALLWFAAYWQLFWRPGL